jgi:[glutamine synthetase] adenylyltransferase / [glutamine synthetase]-adenylyl-L-tyrosine phosphorylase
MTERPVTETGIFSRSGFSNPSKSADLIKTLKAEINHELLIDDLSKVADPDNALLLLVRIADQQDKNLDKVLKDDDARLRLLQVLGSSNGLGEHLVTYPEDVLVFLEESAINKANSKDELIRIFTKASKNSRANLVREYRKVLLGLASRDICYKWPLRDVAAELADAADAILQSALNTSLGKNPELAKQFKLAIIAMGKAGGQELNYVSDVDVIFTAEPSNGVEEQVAISAATKIATEVMQYISVANDGGEIWEVDAALRPEGKAGPLVRTVEQHVAYYQRWASTWEFQALLKARFSAGDLELGNKYLDEITPFVWQAASKENFVDDVQKMRKRVEENIDNRIGERELKLAPGGLRDVEFAVQLLQLVHGRSDVMVRSPNTLEALDQLATWGYIGREDAATFSTAYTFLRTLEHRIQLQKLSRTHVLPEEDSELRKLGRSLGYMSESSADLEKQWRKHQLEVRRIHEKLFYRPLLNAVARLDAGSARLTISEATSRLNALGYKDPESALRHIESLTTGVSRRAVIQKTLLPVLLSWFADGPEPDIALLSFRRLSDALGSTPWFLRLLRDESAAAELMAKLLSSSRYATDLLMSAPEAVSMLGNLEELEPRTREQYETEMNSVIARHETAENIVSAARSFRRRELLRTATADLSGRLTTEEVGIALSNVYASVIETALKGAILAVEQESGKEVSTNMCVIAMGRFGGFELGYGSDADVMFVHEPKKDADPQEAEKCALDIANRLRTLLMQPSVDPPLEIDADLRPEGKNGPLVRTLDSYLAYYQKWSAPWEAQALLRALPVAGDLTVGEKFIQGINKTRYPENGVSEENLREMRRIKARMESERLPRGADVNLNTKLGRGGLSDVEWVVQLLQMQHGAKNESLRITATLPALRACVKAELISETDAKSLSESWTLATWIRNAQMLSRAKANDQIPTDINELSAIAFTLNQKSHAQLIEDYRRITRRARLVMEKIFYGE